ncbi:HPr family phosphocarrier protein [Simiduia agarivorans]|uniref:Phosphohistidinoprotein-hexose phosphotransferase component of N-regulated PTS system (Npr) n=1 Tax=Simiduia agarivorans (strain DSM 21679 / JCM 13881 / BCRC 17597 / SA1) TaxID=1117647 RepID=K4KQU5_SIMAS|nr:HPr family phosphocarrier protein [Simiduia agarivorans]AFV00636.1 phosphohistidinoprotein-hexose phosphotransferase component of N-regulated PTS system (Npr) [Simiduia agarivorans SA1 = DSM 21679]
METRVTIINKLGLHARAAAKLSALAARFDCRIQAGKEGRLVDAKSVMSLMLLAAAQGTELHLVAEGPEQEQAIEAISALINDRFGEGE